jgi:hypothetical protein
MSLIGDTTAACQDTERDSFARDAATSQGRTPLERLAVFADLLETVDAITASLSVEERWRRAKIAFEVDPLPEPWWANFRAEALADFQCPT